MILSLESFGFDLMRNNFLLSHFAVSGFSKVSKDYA